MSQADDLDRMGGEKFVQLTTFRRNGTPVATPVWVVAAGDGTLLVTTPSGSGKVKRLRHTSSVQLRPCSRRGAVPDGAPVLTATARVETGAESVDAAHRLLADEYGLEFRLVMGVERVLRRGPVDRVIVRITPSTPDGHREP